MHRVKAYAVAVFAVGASLAVRLVLEPWLGMNVPYLQFFPAITLASWYGGFGPGALATAISTLVAMYFFLPPAGLAVAGTADLVSLPLFVATGFGIAWLSHLLRAAEAAHRKAVDLAQARAARLDAVLRTAVDGIIVINAKGQIEVFNGGAARLFGYPEEEVVGRNVSMLMPSPHHESHDHYLERYLTTGDAKIIGTGREVMGRRRDGSMFPLHLSVGEMWIDGERKFTGMLHDLSARVQLEEQLRGSEERWRSIVGAAVDGIVVIDAYGRIEAFNAAAERLFGYAEEDVKGQNVKLLMPSPYHEQHDGYLARYHATHEPRIIGTGREVTGRRKDGSTFPLHLSVGELTVKGERKFTGILHDLSERVRMEAQLRDQATLARLGEMAAVVAHEVKNPLAGIRGAIQVLGQRFPPDGRETRVITEIVGRIDTLSGLMGDLLLFSRPPKPRLAPVEVAALVTTTANLLAQDPALRDVEVEIDGAAPPVPADSELLKIVFQNLLVNGAHAMQGKGRIHVGVREFDSTCEVTFKDSGPGIPPDIREKIFTPFFTTKSHGSGLGLPTSKSLIEAHHGRIDIQCPPEGGTVVTIQLPAS
jgi:PAS domain S-box-containing protein